MIDGHRDNLPMTNTNPGQNWGKMTSYEGMERHFGTHCLRKVVSLLFVVPYLASVDGHSEKGILPDVYHYCAIWWVRYLSNHSVKLQLAINISSILSCNPLLWKYSVCSHFQEINFSNLIGRFYLANYFICLKAAFKLFRSRWNKSV